MSRQRLATALIIAGLLLATAILFAETAGHGFLQYDDDVYITGNEHLHDGPTPRAIGWAFTNSHAALWLPLTWISHMVDFALFGADPRGHHLMNLALHLLNTVLIFVVFRRYTGALWRSAAVAALFGWHPLHVESVAWVVERKDTLSTLFFLLMLLAYHRAVHAPSARSRILVAAVLACGIMAKPMLVTAPLLLLILDLWPLRRLDRNNLGALVKEKSALFAIGATMAVVTIIVGNKAGIVASAELVPFTARLMNAVAAIGIYLSKTIWPTGLYAQVPFTLPVPVAPTVIGSLVITVLSTIAVRTRRTRPYLAAGWLWFLVSLVPVLGLVQQGSHAMADRYTYVALILPFAALVWGFDELASRLRIPRRVIVVVAMVIFAVLACQTHRQIGFWRDTTTLFEHALAVNPRNPVALNFLGQGYEEAGDTAAAEDRYRLAVSLKPDLYRAHWNLGRLLAARGEAAEAAEHFRAALPQFGAAAGLHVDLGNQLWQAGRPAEAAGAYEEALARDPDHAAATTNLALVLLELSSTRPDAFERAAGLLEGLARRRPEDPVVSYNLACVRSRQGRMGSALAALQRAFELGYRNREAVMTDPDLAGLRRHEGWTAFPDTLLNRE